jgi:hypothetical protein
MTSFKMLATVCVVAALAACADPARVPEGASRAEVLQRLGQPTGVYAMGPVERLQYSRAPMGTEVTNIDVDASGKVISVVQMLNEARFGQDIKVGTWREADVLRNYGRPEEISRVTSFDGTVWQWRYLASNSHRLLYIYLDPQGIVQRYNVGDDLRYDDRTSRE